MHIPKFSGTFTVTLKPQDPKAKRKGDPKAQVIDYLNNHIDDYSIFIPKNRSHSRDILPNQFMILCSDGMDTQAVLGLESIKALHPNLFESVMYQSNKDRGPLSLFSSKEN